MVRFPTGILSYVTDSFDFWAMISKGLPYLKDVIMRREGNGITHGKLVIRPDSGDPADVICGLSKYEGRTNVTDAEAFGALRTLRDVFGGTYTEKGYFMLDEHIGVVFKATEVCIFLIGVNTTYTIPTHFSTSYNVYICHRFCCPLRVAVPVQLNPPDSSRETVF